MEDIRIEWESPYAKESHPNKCLFCHVDEVRRIYRKFSSFYGLNDKKIEEMISEVIEYHDWGKLNPAWNFNGETTHADFSVQYYLKKKSEEKQDLGEYDCLVAYLILKHHGNLRVTTGFERYRELIESLGPEGKLRSWFFNTFDFKKRVELADAYGLFKIADCLSASSKSGYIPRKPDLNEANLNSFLNDPYRKAEQEDIKNIGRIGFLRAPTGWGKTSASPLYIINKDIKKVFFIFPTITAINSFHNKLSNLFDSDVGKYFYFYDVEIADERLEKSYVDWRIFESQHFLQPYMITSIDQVLLSFLQTGSYHMKRVMFRNTAVIIDEVHLLNDKMLFLLLHIFKKFIDVYNLNILFMSATFPDGLREAIREKMGIITNEKDFVDRISLCADLCRVKFEVRECMLAEEVAKVVEAGKKKKVLVICNTVESAVKIKREIEKYEGVCSLLLHGRFIYNTRREIEEKIEELATTPHILVATQVCEVSLDISYDVMFTELAPLPSLIQRFGRVNRRGKTTREVNVFIYNPEVKNEKYYPYERDELEISKKFLEELREIKTELELFNKLNEVYSKEEMLEKLNKAGDELKLETGFENTNRAGYFFSLDISEEEAMKLLSYRESFTTLIIPYTGLIFSETEEGEALMGRIERLIKRYEEEDEKLSVVSQLKGYAVQVPIYSVKGCVDRRYGGLPLVNKAGNFVYHERYGFIRNEELNTVLG